MSVTPKVLFLTFPKSIHNPSTDLSVINYKRQQIQKSGDNKWRQESMREPERPHRESRGAHPEETESIKSHQTRPEPETGDESRLRGLSSLLMPPSVRKKLEAVAAVSPTENETEGREVAEAAARYYLLETTRQQRATSEFRTIMPPGERGTRQSVGSWKNYVSLEDPFTARTERPISGSHLRELYKVEQEMHDMSEALSSQSISEATISEINELERI